MRRLYINWAKTVSPSRVSRYLGFVIDSEKLQVYLPEDKMWKVRNELLSFKDKGHATKKQLHRLVGLLTHCSKVIWGGGGLVVG